MFLRRKQCTDFVKVERVWTGPTEDSVLCSDHFARECLQSHTKSCPTLLSIWTKLKLLSSFLMTTFWGGPNSNHLQSTNQVLLKFIISRLDRVENIVVKGENADFL